MSKSAKPNVFFLCRKGVPKSAVKINREPTAADLEMLAKMEFELATVGKRYRYTYRCPVNGDGYWYTRRYLLDSAGDVVGSFEDEAGPRGVL